MCWGKAAQDEFPRVFLQVSVDGSSLDELSGSRLPVP